MERVKSFNLFGTEVSQIPCIPGKGSPTTATEGAVGCLYMDTDNGKLYKCTAVADGVYTWVPAETGGGGGGGITVTDDGNGNVTISASGGVSVTDDGNGNVTIG